VLVDVASGLSRRGHNVTIISSDPLGQSSYYPLNGNVQHICLGIGNVTGSSSFSDAVRRMVGYRRMIGEIRPDVVIAFMHSTYLPLGIALLGKRTPIIASEHIGPEHYQSRWLERMLLQLTPLIASKITVVTDQILRSYSRWLRSRMTVVPNPVSFTAKRKQVTSHEDTGRVRILLSVGRLAPQKNQQCLIAAFSEISHKFPNWKLRILGEGELRGALEQQVFDLGLNHKVELPGAVSDVSQEYLRADLFVLPSTYESFGLATAEALLHGLPAIGFADCPGTNTLIRNNENGILVDGPNRVHALATALGQLMANPQELQRLSEGSTERLEKMFDVNTVLDSWEMLIFQVARPNRE